MAGEHRENLDYAWQQQRLWSETATKLKRGIGVGRTVALLLGILAAGLAVSAAQVDDESWRRGLAFAAGVAAALVPFAQRLAGTDRIRDWTRARSASEGLKTEVYEYLGGGSAYEATDRDKRLGQESRAIIEAVSDLQRTTAGVEPGAKDPPGVDGIDSYVVERVDDQIGWYRRKAFGYERTASRLRLAGDVLAAIAAILGIAAAVFDRSSFAAWVPFVTTVGTSLVAHIAASRYDHMIIEYLRTALRLEHLRNSRIDTDMSDAAFVDACEQAISVENQAWMARWNRPEEAEGK